MTWKQTDCAYSGNKQYVKQLNETTFRIIQIVNFPEQSMYTYSVYTVDLEYFSKEELNLEIKGYYSSLSEIQSIYGEDWRMIVAELIAENETDLQHVFYSNRELKEALLRRQYF